MELPESLYSRFIEAVTERGGKWRGEEPFTQAPAPAPPSAPTPPPAPTPEPPAPEVTNWPLIGGIIGAGIVVALIIIFILVPRLRRD